MSKTNNRTTLTAAEQSRRAHADARAGYASRQELHRQAVAAAEDLVARLANGDDTPTAADLGLARDAVERAELLVAAAEAKVKRTEQALINDETTLAALFADDVVTPVFDGQVPVKITGVPAEAQPEVNGDPVVWIVQENPTSRSGGILSGVLDVVFYRRPLYAELDAHTLEHRCRSLGFIIQPHQVQQSVTGEMHRDALRLRVNRAFQAVPELPAAPTAEAVRDFARAVNGDLGQAVTGRKTTTYLGQRSAGSAASELVDSRAASPVTADDGTVQLTVETTSRVTLGAGITPPHANERLRRAITDEVQKMADGVGRVVNAEPVTIDMPDPGKPHGNRSWTVTARFVLAYRLS